MNWDGFDLLHSSIIALQLTNEGVTRWFPQDSSLCVCVLSSCYLKSAIELLGKCLLRCGCEQIRSYFKSCKEEPQPSQHQRNSLAQINLASRLALWLVRSNALVTFQRLSWCQFKGKAGNYKRFIITMASRGQYVWLALFKVQASSFSFFLHLGHKQYFLPLAPCFFY